MTPQANLIAPDTYERDGIPHDQLRWLRQHAPVFWHADGGGNGAWPGFWAITRHEDVEHVSRHPETFSSHRRLALFIEMPSDEIELQRLMPGRDRATANRRANLDQVQGGLRVGSVPARDNPSPAAGSRPPSGGSLPGWLPGALSRAGR